jgi:hypothetical protein
MLPLPEAIMLVQAPFAPPFSHQIWFRAQQLLLPGAMLGSDLCTVIAALWMMWLATERHFTHAPWVLPGPSGQPATGVRFS